MIRAIHEHELEPLLDLYRHLHDSDLPLPDRERIMDIWAEICSDPKIRYFVVEEDGKLVASCHIVLVPNLTRGARPYGLIENVVTHREYRRLGHGKRVLRRALEWAWEQGCYKVMLMTGRREEDVDNFYASVGFECGRKRGFVIRNPLAC